MAEIIIKEGSAPATPATGYISIYADSVDSRIKYKEDTGAVRDMSPSGSIPGGRVTATTAVPVVNASVFNVGIVYYTPYLNGKIRLYDGTSWVNYDFTELSNTFANSSVGNAGPAATANTSNYDLFVWTNSTTVTLTRGPAWSSSTSRGTGAATTELEQFEGVYVNKFAITNGPAARYGRYVGTIRTNGTATLTHAMTQSPASGGNNSQVSVWNMYNRVPTYVTSRDAANSWSHSSTTIRAANASNSNRISYVVGQNEDCVLAIYSVPATGGTLSAANAYIGIDSVTVFSGASGSTPPVVFGSTSAFYVGQPGLGAHFIQALESVSSDMDAVTFYGDNNAPTATQMSLMAVLMM